MHALAVSNAELRRSYALLNHHPVRLVYSSICIGLIHG